jgi:hypothetical protein
MGNKSNRLRVAGLRSRKAAIRPACCPRNSLILLRVFFVSDFEQSVLM